MEQQINEMATVKWCKIKGEKDSNFKTTINVKVLIFVLGILYISYTGYDASDEGQLQI